MIFSMHKKSIRVKLMGAFLLLSFMLLTVGSLGFFFQTQIVENYGHIVNINLPNAVTLGDMNQDATNMTKGLLELSLGVAKPEDAEAIKEKIKLSIDSYEKLKSQYEATKISAQGEAEVYAPVKENWPKIKELVLNNIELASSIDSEKKQKFAKSYREELGPLIHDFSDNLNFVLDFQKAASSENVENATSMSNKSNLWMSIVIITGVIFALGFGWFFSGNLSRELMNLASDLLNVVTKVSTESTKMSHSSKSLTLSVDEQAAAIQETSSSAEELASMVKRNEENADGSKKLSDHNVETAMQGRRAVTEMMEAISEIDKSNQEILVSVDKSNSNINDISNYIKQIGEKTKIINDIVFQTKLLSFNASVEAARAGEQGKGFAVVAEEVGNLAQMSGNAAKEISEMLESSIRKVEDIIADSKREVEVLVDHSKTKITQGVKTAENCEIVLDNVVQNVTKVNEMLLEISEASKEQTIGIGEISKAIAQLDANTSSNSQTARTSEVSSEELASEANKLEKIVSRIMAVVKGQN